MNSTYPCIYPTQREAVRQATIDAKQSAKDNDCVSQEQVALLSGDTLIIEASPNGKVTKTFSGGWNKGGLVYMSTKVAKVFGLK